LQSGTLLLTRILEHSFRFTVQKRQALRLILSFIETQKKEKYFMEKSFIKQVRENKVPKPNAYNFQMSQWRAHYMAGISRSLADKQLYHAGKWLGQNFEYLRRYSLGTIKFLPLKSKEDLIRLQTGMVNLQAKKIIARSFEIFSTNLHTQFQMSQSVRDIESLISSARYPLTDISNLPTSSSESETQNIGDLPKLLTLITDQGRLRHLFHHLWNECLWNDWHLNYYSEQIEVMVPADFLREEIYQVNLHRWESISIGLQDEWLNMSNKNNCSTLDLPHITVNGENSSQNIHLDICKGREIDLPSLQGSPNISLALFLQQDFYHEDIFDKPLPKFGGFGSQALTLRKILAAWRLIATMASDIQVHLPQVENTLTQCNLFEFSPVFLRTELAEIVSQTICDVDYRQAIGIIELLTFENDYEQDLWHRPLIKVDNEKLTLIILALKSPNLSRLVSHWMEKGGVKISKKGKKFEHFIRDKLHKVNRLSNVQVYPEHFEPSKLVKRTQVGDIDLILRIGQKIIIGESKCSLFPSDPHNINKYDEGLEKGAAQAKIKASFVKENLDAFLKIVNFSSIFIDRCIRVIPLVISNLPLATGYKFREVPVVDLQVLEDYLSGGQLGSYQKLSSEGRESVSAVENFYTSEQEAEDLIDEYLDSPPQVRRLLEKLRWEIQPIPQLNDEIAPLLRSIPSVQLFDDLGASDELISF
jgi:hypothetical protein